MILEEFLIIIFFLVQFIILLFCELIISLIGTYQICNFKLDQRYLPRNVGLSVMYSLDTKDDKHIWLFVERKCCLPTLEIIVFT